MKKSLQLFSHFLKKHALLSGIFISSIGIISYSYAAMVSTTSFIDERVQYILSVFEANELQYNLTGSDRSDYYKVLKEIYIGVIKGINLKLGESALSGLDEAIEGGVIRDVPLVQKYNEYVFYIRNLPIGAGKTSTLDGIAGGKKIIVSCGNKATNDMVSYSVAYDNSSNAMIRTSDVRECMKKGHDLVITTDHTSLCGLFGPARWSSQLISPSIASLDAPDNVENGLATWTFSCANPPGVNVSIDCKSGSTKDIITNGKKCSVALPNGQLNQTVVTETMLNGAQGSATLKCTTNGWEILEGVCLSETPNTGTVTPVNKVNALCGSAAGKEIVRDPNTGLRIGADTSGLCSVGLWKQTTNANGVFDYIVEGANTSVAQTDVLYWENANLLYTCGGLNGGSDTTCRTGKVKQDGFCDVTPLLCRGGKPNLNKLDESNPNGLIIRTYEKNRYDPKAYWDGEYNWECQGINGGATVQCKSDNYQNNAACSSEYISRGAVDKIIIGNNTATYFFNRTNSSIPFSGTCGTSYPTGVTCNTYSFDPSKLCVVPAGFGGNPGELVQIIDGEGNDGQFNWTCAGSDRFGRITNSRIDCSVAKIQ